MTYPRVDERTFKESLPHIKKHIGTCEDCQDFMQRFLHRNPKDEQDISVRPDRVRKWTLNGPSTSLHKNPFKGFFVQAAQNAISAVESPEDQVAHILYFEYTLLWHNRSKGRGRHSRRQRRQGAGRKPWELDRAPGGEELEHK